MGGRGSNSKIQKKKTDEEILAEIIGARLAVNPNFDKGRTWQVNCQRCVVAYELQRRGINAEAKANTYYTPAWIETFDFDANNFDNYYSGSNESHKSSYDLLKKWDGWDGKYKIPNPNRLGKTTKAVAQNIDKAMEKWGDGSRAVMFVAWKGSTSCHIVNVERINGKTYIVDAQDSNRRIQSGISGLEGYIGMTQPTRTELYRVDNLKMRSGFNTKNNGIFKINEEGEKK